MNEPDFMLWPETQIEPYLNYLVVECGLTENTIRAYRSDMQRFVLFVEICDFGTPDDINPLALQNYARWLSRQSTDHIPLSTASIARHLVSARMFMRYQLLVGIASKDVCSAMDTPKTWQRLPRVLAKKQTISLVTAVNPKHPLATRDRALLELLYATGLRASEAADLELKNMNFQIGFLRCFGKGNKERIVPIHQGALNLLLKYVNELRTDLVAGKTAVALFVSRTGRKLNRIEIWRIVRKAAVRAGLTGKITPHTLRHCFGSHLLQGGADLRSVQEMLGHADVTTTQIYTHVDQEHLRKIHKKYHPRP